MNNFGKAYWENNYKNNETGWDIGHISTPLKTYIDQINNKNLKILIPGAGNAYEVEYLYNSGFKNVFVLDIATQPLKNLQKRLPNFPKNNFIQQDFFSHSETYDLILEQTFFCSLDPSLRKKYTNKTYDLLNSKGKLVGLFFDFYFKPGKPPFGGSLTEYKQQFSKKFKINILERCHNSIKPRNGSELFFIFEKNNN
jgi:thiopurine S-methyltransferase